MNADSIDIRDHRVVEVWMNLSTLYLERGDLDAALRLIQCACLSSPAQNGTVMEQLGDLFLRAGAAEQAEAAWLSAGKLCQGSRLQEYFHERLERKLSALRF